MSTPIAVLEEDPGPVEVGGVDRVVAREDAVGAQVNGLAVVGGAAQAGVAALVTRLDGGRKVSVSAPGSALEVDQEFVFVAAATRRDVEIG